MHYSEADSPLMPIRGVYIEEIAAPGEHWYKLVLSNGKVGTVHLPDELVDDLLVERLLIYLDASDPVQTKLKAI